MSNILVAQMKQYIKQTHTPMRNRTSWQSRTRGRVFEDKQNVQQGGEQPQGAFNQSEKPLAEQVKYYKEYTSLLKEGRDVFPSSVEYQNWKEQLDTSYENNLPLDTFSYTLDMFTALQKAETSAIYQQEVDSLAKDKDNFSEFTEIAQKTGEEYIDPSFTSTSGFNSALEATTTNADDISIITAKQVDVNRNVEMPATNMAVIDLVNGMPANPEALYDTDGLVDKAQLTTVKQQQNKEEMFHNLIESSTSQEEVDSIVEAFTPDTLRHCDPEANIAQDKEMGSAFTLEQDDALTFDRVADSLVVEVLSSDLSSALDASAQDIETYDNPEPGLEGLFKLREPMGAAPNPNTLGVETELEQ